LKYKVLKKTLKGAPSVESDTFLSSRQKILQFLLVNRSDVHQSSTVKEIAAELDISVNAARQYLNNLESEGLVVRSQQKSSTGRPAMAYTLHESALETFPKQYVDFAVKMLIQVRDKIGVKLTQEVLDNVGKQIADEVKPFLKEMLGEDPENVPLDARIRAVVNLLRDYGKFPSLVETEDAYDVQNFNCLVYGVVKEDPLVCRVDEKIMSELIGKKCEKTKCIRDGDECCLYRVQKD
jgi:predicted ArsR family transcriptional regulator